jgi:hypothetical protein
MKKLTKFQIILIVIFAIQIPLIFLGALFKILHLPGANFMLIISMGSMAVSTLIFWLSAIVQMVTNSFENKVMWLFLMFIFPFATPIIFLLTKDERIKTA